MTIASIIVSITALCFSAFTFYWTTLRTAKALYFVPLSFQHPGTSPQFAFINAGSKDILLARVSAYFDFEKSRQWFRQNVEFIPSTSQLLAHGESAICKIDFADGFLPVKCPEAITPDNGLRRFDLTLLVEWVDGMGHIQKSSVRVYDFELHENGGYSMSSVLTSRVNLYHQPKVDFQMG